MEKNFNFLDLKRTLFGGNSKMVHQMELMVDKEVKEAFLGKPINSIIEEIDFWYKAGYEYVPIVISVFGFMGDNNNVEITQEKNFKYSKYSLTPQKRSWAREGKGVITTFKEFHNFPWPDPEKIDLSIYLQAREKLPKEIGIIGVIPRIFVAVWMLMGFEQFSYSLKDQSELVSAIFNKVGEIQYRIICRLSQEVDIDAIWLGDDIAYGQGLMVSHSIFRSLLFPWYKEIGNICKKKHVPFIYHSDGNLFEVMNDLIDCGINALHPVEPNAMDAVILKKEFGNHICIIGNIELDILSRGSIQDIEKLTLSRLKKLWDYGGYCPGSSNSVSNYVPLENYLAMLNSIQYFRENIEVIKKD
jgi:uroporphyrinogen decarboxylase